jgi:hypothetical protein
VTVATHADKMNKAVSALLIWRIQSPSEFSCEI